MSADDTLEGSPQPDKLLTPHLHKSALTSVELSISCTVRASMVRRRGEKLKKKKNTEKTPRRDVLIFPPPNPLQCWLAGLTLRLHWSLFWLQLAASELCACHHSAFLTSSLSDSGASQQAGGASASSVMDHDITGQCIHTIFRVGPK